MILEGVLLGSGVFNTVNGRNTRIEFSSSNEDFLRWLDFEIGIFSTGLKKFDQSDALGDVSHVRTRALPEMSRMQTEWGYSERKGLPKGFTRTPLQLKSLYAVRGFVNSSDKPEIMLGRRDYTDDEIETIFEGFNPNVRRSDFRQNGIINKKVSERVSCVIRTPKKFFEYIGWEPIPGCESKWPPTKPRDIKRRCVGCAFPLNSNDRYCSDACRESIEPESACTICTQQLDDIDKHFHHVSYAPEEGITVCASCHSRIHNQPGFFDELIPLMSRKEAEELGLSLHGFGLGGNVDGPPPVKSLHELDTVDFSANIEEVLNRMQ